MMQKGRVTMIELVALICIGLELLYFAGNAFGWLDFHVRSGNDKTYINTCESVAKVNSLNGIQCPVDDCSNSHGTCEHYISGKYVGYYDINSHKIVGNKIKGYNDSQDPEIDGNEYMGEKDTMILEVIVEDNTIQLLWTGGAS